MLKLKQYFNENLSSFIMILTMCSMKFSTHKRINVLHFWLSDITTISEDKLKKRKYLEELKNII